MLLEGAMKMELRKERGREPVIAFAAGAAILCASLANFLNYNDYPILRPEVGLIASALLAIAAVMMVVYVGQRQWGRSFLEGLLALLFLDLNSDSLLIAVAAGVAVALITFWKRTSLLVPMAVIGVVILAAKAFGIGDAPSWIRVERGTQPSRASAAAAAKPAIVHIILDEHIGLEGLRNEGPQGQQLSDELRNFYLARGFAVYGGAYSRYFHTVNAIPDMLNYDRRLAKSGGESGGIAGPTEHLEALVDSGYRLTIFQSDFVDFCAGARFYQCITYDSFSLRPTLVAPLSTGERARLASIKFLDLSSIFAWAWENWNGWALFVRAKTGHSMPIHQLNTQASSSIASFEAMDALIQRVKTIKSGDAIFAHLLLPHFPYVVGSDCGYLAWKDWEFVKSTSPIQVRRRAYYTQVHCTTERLASVLIALSQSPAGNNAVLIIHGDHGSRITRLNPVEANRGRFGDADMVAGFSTLFAIRVPGVKAAYFAERQPVPALLRELSASGFRSAPHPRLPSSPTVFLDDSNWKPVRAYPLPSWWISADSRPDSRQPAPTRLSH